MFSLHINLGLQNLGMKTHSFGHHFRKGLPGGTCVIHTCIDVVIEGAARSPRGNALLDADGILYYTRGLIIHAQRDGLERLIDKYDRCAVDW